MSVNNKEIMLEDTAKQKCEHGYLFKDVFWADKERVEFETPSNIVGYYLRMIKDFLGESDEYKKVSVKPAINKNFNEDFGNPVVTVKRDTVSPMNLGVMGNKTDIASAMPEAIPNFEVDFPDASLDESVVYSDLVTIGIHLNIYSSSLAEVEAIANLIYPLITATSYDALKYPFPFIKYVNPPTLSPVDVVEKYDDVYMANIAWSLTYKDDTVLLIRKNVIKYARITVEDGSNKNVTLVSST